MSLIEVTEIVKEQRTWGLQICLTWDPRRLDTCEAVSDNQWGAHGVNIDVVDPKTRFFQENWRILSLSTDEQWTDHLSGGFVTTRPLESSESRRVSFRLLNQAVTLRVWRCLPRSSSRSGCVISSRLIPSKSAKGEREEELLTNVIYDQAAIAEAAGGTAKVVDTVRREFCILTERHCHRVFAHIHVRCPKHKERSCACLWHVWLFE